MKTVFKFAAVSAAVLVFFVFSARQSLRPAVMAGHDAQGHVTEEVEAVTYRTRLRHAGCPSNGFLNAYGRPERITAYGIDKNVWPHKCDGCGYTNTIYDAQWPQFRREWRAVR